MTVVCTGQFSMEFEGFDVEEGTPKQDFREVCDDLWEVSFKAWSNECYRDEAHKALKRCTDNQEMLSETLEVLSRERQAVTYQLMSELIESAFQMGKASTMTAMANDLTKSQSLRMANARAAIKSSIPPETEMAIFDAIQNHGPKTSNIQKHLRSLKVKVSNDTIERRREEFRRSLQKSGGKSAAAR